MTAAPSTFRCRRREEEFRRVRLDPPLEGRHAECLLADHLVPTKRRLDGELDDLKVARATATNKARQAERRFTEVQRLLEELNEFIAKVAEIAERGPPPPDQDARRAKWTPGTSMDLDDGVMVNSAALWPLLEPQWKDPKKWWKELANAKGKKDYDWSHLAARYFPTRVRKKCHEDPSLAVAHKCFWELHPAKAYAWELRLQDEIRPDFTIDEPGSDAARARFLHAEHREAADIHAAETSAESARRQRRTRRRRSLTSLAATTTRRRPHEQRVCHDAMPARGAASLRSVIQDIPRPHAGLPAAARSTTMRGCPKDGYCGS